MNQPTNSINRRVTFVIAGLSSGGAERAASTMANYWAARGWTIHMLSLDDPKVAPFYHLHPDVQLRSLKLFRPYGNPLVAGFQLISRAWKLRKAITATRPDCVISFDDVTNVFVGLSMSGTKVPVIAAERNDPHCHPLKNPWRLMRVWAYSNSRCVVAQSRHALEFFPRKIRDRGRVIPNPVRAPEANWADNFSGDRKSGGLVLAIGRLEKQKGFDLLIEAFGRAAESHPDWNLEIWGAGTQRGILQSMIEAEGLHERIALRGITKNPGAAMRHADIFVLSSRYEGFPNALCEAMACGLPSLSFDCPNGPSEIIRNGVDGILVPRDNAGALAEALQKLMSNEGERLRLGARAPEIIQRFGLEKIMNLWTALVDEVIGRRQNQATGENAVLHSCTELRGDLREADEFKSPV